MNNAKPWKELSHVDRITFISTLNQPHAGLDAAIARRDNKEVISDEFIEEYFDLISAGIVPLDGAMSCEDLAIEIDKDIESISEDILTFDERAAIQTIDDGLTTTRRAINALQRKERFAGEYDVAKAWLAATGIGIFRSRGYE